MNNMPIITVNIHMQVYASQPILRVIWLKLMTMTMKYLFTYVGMVLVENV